jgi:hypothetical protein
MTKVGNTGGQDSPPDELLAELRKRLDNRWREIAEKSAIKAKRQEPSEEV